MPGFSTYLENAVLDQWFGGVAATIPGTLYVGLSTTDPLEAGTGITEPPTANGYTRAAVANNTTNWPATGGDGTKANGTAIAFPAATGDWGTVTHFFIATAATGGNILASSTIGTPKTITNGDTASFGAGSLTITLE
ncbi:phage tail fiber protein [Neobacillus sp. C211]|uniref:phage tail fiber protein n=1 Tax=unclassified Neobacillus TaxID=2675272 RepID=UPI00397AF34A